MAAVGLETVLYYAMSGLDYEVIVLDYVREQVPGSFL